MGSALDSSRRAVTFRVVAADRHLAYPGDVATGMPTKQMWTWAIAGLILTVVVWVILVPWDFFEGSSGGGGDDTGRGLGLSSAWVTVVAVSVVLAGRFDATWLGTAAAVTWASLFAWRAAVSESSGANMWPVAFVLFVLPAAAVANLVVQGAAQWRSRR